MGAYSEILRSQKLQALNFTSDYTLGHGRSPATGEIAIALGVSDTRAKALVKKPAFEKMIERAASVHRARVALAVATGRVKTFAVSCYNAQADLA